MIQLKLLGAAVAGVVALSASMAMAAGDADAGKKVFNKCRACHKLEAGANGVGPTLHGVVGREAGSVEGFKYSKAMQESGVVWNEDALSQYLEDPRKFMPGNKMAFPGLRNADERDNVIAYLKQESQ